MAQQSEEDFSLPTLSALIVVAMVLTAFCASLLWISFGHLREVEAARNWPTAPAVVLSSDVAYCRFCSGRRFSLGITYEYFVGEKTYTGRNLRLGTDTFYSQFEADAAQQRFHAGHRLPVYYNPRRPSQAVLDLDAGLLISDWLTVCLFAVMSVGAIAIGGRFLGRAVAAQLRLQD